jgi:rubrerythrin
MTSRAAFENHPQPHVLPADADPDEEGSTVPIADYDYGPEWADLAERVDDLNESEAPEVDEPEAEKALTDGGTEPVNTFVCGYTGCGETVEGYPDQCPHCEGNYNWTDS